MLKKIIIPIAILLGLGLMFKNAYHYPPTGGYDAKLHLNYSKIISHEYRFPTFKESRENYNPPLFYLTSGLVTRAVSQLTNQDYATSLKSWQYLSVIMAAAGLYFWFLIFKYVYPKQKHFSWLFLGLTFSLPVFHKTIVMYSIETFFLFLTSLIFYYLAVKFIPKPTTRKAVILGLLTSLLLLTRMSAVVVLLTVITSLIGLLIIKKINLKQLVVFLLIILGFVFASTSWFYIGRSDQDIYGVGEGGEPDKPFFQRQPLSFYIDVPFKFMMTYPVRLHDPLNKLVPIYYSEFWGDFWNYYPQRRFGKEVSEIRKNRLVFTPKRAANLALQNQINLPITLLMLAGFFYALIKNIKKLFNKPDNKWLIELSMLTLSILTWLGFLALLTKYPSWKGDSIKASYMLYNLPIYIYFLTTFLHFLYQKSRLIFIPVMVYLLVSSVINLYWSWF